MTAKYFAILTNYGAAQLANAVALGTQMNISAMAVGDGGGTLPVPDPAQTKLVRENRRAAVNQVSVDEKNPNFIIAEQVIPENEGGWWIREIGLFDDTGGLIAVGNAPETYKPNLQEGSGRTQVIQMVLMVSSTQAITLKVDPSVVLATREYVTKSVAAAIQESETKTAKIYATKSELSSGLSGKQPTGDYATKTEVGLKLDKTAVVQAPGTSTTNVMSQKAVTDIAATKFDKTGGTITGATIISRSWEALKISATAPGATHFIRLADTGGDTASLGFLSDNSNNLSLNNEKTSTMFHVADGEIRVNSKRCLTTDDLSAAVPVGGSVIWNSSSPIPANFWKHDGRSFSAAEYPEAAKALPDLKVPKDGGYFLRITDDGAGVDPGRQVGTYQGDAGRRLEGKFSLRGTNGTGGRTAFFGSGVFNPIGVGDGSVQGYAYNTFKDESPEAAGGQRIIFDSDNIYQSASEFRPKNVSKFLIVRMK